MEAQIGFIKLGFKHYLLFGAVLIPLVFVHIYYHPPVKVGRSLNLSGVMAMSQSPPVLVEIPELGIKTTDLVELGLNSDKTIQVPNDGEKIGWYKYRATPGEIGPAVMIGHLDWYNNQSGIFANLHKLEMGDKIKIKRENGTTAIFQVTGKEKYLQDDFQTEKVYGKIEYPGLRLITCTGDFLESKGHYSQNLVVFAVLAGHE